MRLIQAHFLILLLLLSIGRGSVSAQEKDTTKVDDRTFLQLLRQAEELNTEQKERAKRTINSRLLQKLSEDEDPGVRFYVAFNAYTPVDALVNLAEDPNQTVRWAVARNSRLMFAVDVKFQEYLDSGGIPLELAQTFGTNGIPLSPNTTVEKQDGQWQVDTEGRTYTVKNEGNKLHVYNERIPDATMGKLGIDYVKIVRVGLASNPNLPARVLRNLAGDVSISARRKVAANLNTDPQILEILSRDRERSVQLAVANNPHTPLRVMEAFSVSSDDSFRIATAGNIGTSPAILLGLLFDPSDQVREMIAAHKDMPAPGLIRLAEDPLLAVRQGVVSNPNTPGEALKRLSFDKDRQVRADARVKLARILKKQIEEDMER